MDRMKTGRNSMLGSTACQPNRRSCRHGHEGWIKPRVKYDRRRDTYRWTTYCMECDRLGKHNSPDELLADISADMSAKSEPVSTELTRSIRQDLDRFHRGAQMTFDREDILDVLDMYERSLANRADMAAENERLRAQLKAEHDTAVAAIAGSEKEIERLRSQIDTCQGNAHYRAWQESQAENERLRAALEARGQYCAQHGEHQPCSQ